MCGIFGYKGMKNSFSVVFNGLKDLEYRGYDSWGIASLIDGEIKVVKKTGKIGEDFDEESVKSSISIGHTRWSTHGIPSDKNAHPHFSCDKKIAVVHNGIIENHDEIRARLKGHKFKSDTDTEVIAHLIEEYMKKYDYKEAVVKALGELEGSFALMILNSEREEIIAVRRGSPLVLGVKKEEFFLASDILALLR
nr:class II glutamine amidotransferase [Candidatus Woesearchaeota archaeon]